MIDKLLSLLVLCCLVFVSEALSLTESAEADSFDNGAFDLSRDLSSEDLEETVS